MANHTTSGSLPLLGHLDGAWCRYDIEAPRGLVLLVHGQGEHMGRYSHVAAHLNHAGFAVHTFDLRGHGLSGGTRGHTMSWADYLDDVDRNLRLAREAVPGVPWFLLGHSMGGLVAIRWAQERPQALPSALIVSNPLLQLAFEVPKLKATVGRWMSDIWPSLALPTGLDANGLCHDQAVVQAYKSDPLVHDKASSRWFTSMTDAMAKSHTHARDLMLPVLTLIGASDPIVAAAGAERFHQAVGSADKRKEVWPHMFHEIFNEPDKDLPLNATVSFMNEHLG